MVWPERAWRDEAIVIAFSTNGLGASDAASDVEMLTCCCCVNLCWVEVGDDGTKPYVAVPRMEAMAIELAEKSFMVEDQSLG